MAAYIEVYQGNQIGGCITVISTDKTKIVIDFGENLPGSAKESNIDFDWEKDIWLSDINHIFFFKALGETEYHRAIANYKDSYRSLLALLQNKPMYYDSHDGNHYIDEEKDTLEFMTGIKFDI